jgi:hypothetical protein
MASVDDKPTELTLTALTRGRFCELAGAELGVAGGSELFTLGLFSVLDALMDMPMHEAVESLPLADDIRGALVHRQGPMGELLEAVAAREGGAEASLPHVDELYLRAVIWANTAAESLLAGAPAPSATAPALSATAPAPSAATPVPTVAAPAPSAAASATSRGPVRKLFAAIGRIFGARR